MLGQGPTHNQLEAEATAEARYPTSRSQTLPGHSRPFATLPVTWAETPWPWIMNGHFCRHLGAVLTITANSGSNQRGSSEGIALGRQGEKGHLDARLA